MRMNTMTRLVNYYQGGIAAIVETKRVTDIFQLNGQFLLYYFQTYSVVFQNVSR